MMSSLPFLKDSVKYHLCRQRLPSTWMWPSRAQRSGKWSQLASFCSQTCQNSWPLTLCRGRLMMDGCIVKGYVSIKSMGTSQFPHLITLKLLFEEPWVRIHDSTLQRSLLPANTTPYWISVIDWTLWLIGLIWYITTSLRWDRLQIKLKCITPKFYII